MLNYLPITDAHSRLLDEISWSHAFIRELYFLSSHHLIALGAPGESRPSGDADGPRHVRLMVACPGSSPDSGVEFVFLRTRQFSVGTLDEVRFRYSFDRHAGHWVSFDGDDGREGCRFAAEEVFVKFLGHSYIGPRPVLGHAIPTADAAGAVPMEDGWRICEHCRNAWQELPEVEFGICPECGAVTRLRTPFQGWRFFSLAHGSS